MQVTLNIEAGQLGDTIVDMFHNLSDEQKESLALKVMEKWVAEPMAVERSLATEELLRKWRSKSSNARYGPKTDEDILKDYSFKTELNNIKTSKEVMIREITDKLNSFFQEKVEEVVKNDEKVKEALDLALVQATAKFPILIQNAMTNWFVDHISSIAEIASQTAKAPQTNDSFDFGARF